MASTSKIRDSRTDRPTNKHVLGENKVIPTSKDKINCYTCGTVGHTSRTCTKKSKKIDDVEVDVSEKEYSLEYEEEDEGMIVIVEESHDICPITCNEDIVGEVNNVLCDDVVDIEPVLELPESGKGFKNGSSNLVNVK